MSNLSSARRIYLIGLKGVGMTALAQIIKAQGKEVWGVDSAEHFFTERVLAKAGVECLENFSAEHLNRQIDLVIYSTAYTAASNVEVKAAQAKGLKMMTYPEALGELTREAQAVAVAGSHGKTTTTAWLAHVLQAANLSPAALVGSEVKQWGGNVLTGTGELFVFEADEYQNKFQHYSPHAMVLTSIQWDHPDWFKTPEDYFVAFVEFLKKLPADGFVVANYDDALVKKAVAAANLKPEQIVTYGLKNGYWQMLRMWLDEGKWYFSVHCGEEFKGDFWLKLIGSHNVSNALAVIACASRLGVDLEVIRTALATFEGTTRRFEEKGKLTNAVTLIDDYAHHPAEVRATLKAARAFYPFKNIRVVFQPHTFSRTQALLSDFATAFADADEVVVLPTYSSTREQGGGVNSEQLTNEVQKNHPLCLYKQSIAEAATYLADTANRRDIVITMGAGDVWQVGDLLIKQFGLTSGSEF